MNTRIKILLLTTQLGYGGAETSFIRLANFLAQSMDVTVALFTRDYGHTDYASGHEHLSCPVTLLDEPKTQGRFRRWYTRWQRLRLLKQKHDLTISFLSGPNILNALTGLNARTIVSIRGSRRFDPLFPALMRRLFHYILDPITYQFAASIIPISHGLANEIAARHAHKITVIPPFIMSTEFTARLGEQPPAPYAALTGQPVIVGLGRLSREKGFHHLIRVFAHIVHAQPGTKLLLIGDGPMLGELRALCVNLGITMDDLTPEVSAVIFTGYQANPLPLLKLSTVFAMTSATEGFGNVMLEAMAAGLPIIAADTPWGARDILWQNPPDTKNPYPTTTPTIADYGTLMPRIDLPIYESAWVETLTAALASSTADQTPQQTRLAQYDLAVIGSRWVMLIEQNTMGPR